MDCLPHVNYLPATSAAGVPHLTAAVGLFFSPRIGTDFHGFSRMNRSWGRLVSREAAKPRRERLLAGGGGLFF